MVWKLLTKVDLLFIYFSGLNSTSNLLGGIEKAAALKDYATAALGGLFFFGTGGRLGVFESLLSVRPGLGVGVFLFALLTVVYFWSWGLLLLLAASLF
jgi:hypothetical protein